VLENYQTRTGLSYLAFSTRNWMHVHSSCSRQTSLGFCKVKNLSGWQFVGDGGSSQFNVTICCNVPLCVAELVHWLLYTVRPELYVISRYIFVYFSIYIKFSFTKYRTVYMGNEGEGLGNYIVRRKPKHCAGYMTNMDTWREIVG